MEEIRNTQWQEWHRRSLAGEILSAEEQSAYEAGCQSLDAGEKLDGDLEKLRALRIQLLEADQERWRLQRQEQLLNARIADLEAHLDERTRRLLGIGV